MLYHDFICEELEPYCPLVRVTGEGIEPQIVHMNLKSFNEKDLMHVLSTLVKRIEIVEGKDRPESFKFVLYPLYADDKGDEPSGE